MPLPNLGEGATTALCGMAGALELTVEESADSSERLCRLFLSAGYTLRPTISLRFRRSMDCRRSVA